MSSHREQILDQLGVDCFEELFFTNGIATMSCYCSDEMGSKVYGFDEDEREMVSIDFMEGNLTHETYVVDDNELREAKWHQMLHVSIVVQAKEFLALITTATDRNNKLVWFTLKNGAVVVSNIINLDEADFDEAEYINLIQLGDPTRYFYIKIKHVHERTELPQIKAHMRHIYSDVTLGEIIDNRTILWKHFLVKHELFHPTGYNDRICFYSPSNFLTVDNDQAQTPINRVLFTVPLEGIPSNECDYLTEKPAVSNDILDLCPAVGSTKNEIFYFAYNEKLNQNLLLGIDVNACVLRQHFVLGEHPVRTKSVLIYNNRIVINGKCCSCAKWHTYHFVVQHLFGRICSLSLNEIKVILSPTHNLIICDGIRKELIQLWVLRQRLLYHAEGQRIIFYTGKGKALNDYSDILSKFPLYLTEHGSGSEPDNDVEFKNESFILENTDDISYRTLMSLSWHAFRYRKPFLVLLNKIITTGFDHPNEFIKWIGVASTMENKQLVKEATSTEHPLQRYYPDWEARFAKISDASTILIPPCADIDRTFTNTAVSGTIGRDSERDFVEKLMQLRIGGILLTGIKSKEFLKSHNAKHDAAFEIDGLLLHAEYGIIMFECKATTSNESVPFRDQERIKKAVKQLSTIRKALITSYMHSSKMNLADCFIHMVIVVPNSELETTVKENFQNTTEIAIWDREDLLEDNVRAKLSVIKETINTIQYDSVIDRVNHDSAFKNFTKTTAACRSLEFLSQKHNVMAITNMIDRQLSLKSTTPKQNKINDLSYGSVRKQIIYLSREQEKVLHDEDSIFQVISGAPGTGKTLLILLKALSLARNRNFKRNIWIETESLGSMLDIRKFFALNLGQEDNMPCVHDGDLRAYCAPEDALFMDELFATGQFIDRLKWRTNFSGPTFLCISGYTSPIHLSQSNIERQLEQLSCDKMKHSYLTTVYRGTENIINNWKPIYGETIAIDVGHKILGYQVEEHDASTFNELFRTIVKKLDEFDRPSGHNADRSAYAVIVDSALILDALGAFLSCAGIPCGIVTEQARNASLIAVDFANNCLSMEWPVVFYIETGLLCDSGRSRFIASSRAIVKLVVHRRDNTKLAELFTKMLREKCKAITEISFVSFMNMFAETQRILYKDDPHHLIALCFLRDVQNTVMRLNYWPCELKQYPPFSKCDGFYEALSVISQNESALNWILCLEFTKAERVFTGKTLRDKNKIPMSFRKILKDEIDETDETVTKRWNACYELCEAMTEAMTPFRTRDIEKEKATIKAELNDQYQCFGFMSTRIICVCADVINRE